MRAQRGRGRKDTRKEAEPPRVKETDTDTNQITRQSRGVLDAEDTYPTTALTELAQHLPNLREMEEVISLLRAKALGSFT